MAISNEERTTQSNSDIVWAAQSREARHYRMILVLTLDSSHSDKKEREDRRCKTLAAASRRMGSLLPALTEDLVNFPHDLLGPLNGRRYQLVRVRAAAGRPKQIARGPHVHRRKDRGHDAEHAFASFVHDRYGTISLFVRLGDWAF